jgi:two-component system, OmpR family, sensor kinase
MSAPRRRGSLAVRMALLTTAIAVITALIAGALSIQLIRTNNASAAQKSLASIADSAQAEANSGTTVAEGQLRARATLRALKIQFVPITAKGAIQGGTAGALGREALTSSDVSSLLAGKSLSTSRTVGGVRFLIEGRPTNDGAALVLLQRRADATAVGDEAIRRLIVALASAVGVAIVLGLLVAWRLALPLRRTAQAAHALADGRRDVAVEPQGPQEVAQVGEALNVLASNLAHSEARQREFLMSVSHDLRTPLTAIRGYAESLADGVVPGEDAPRVGAVMLAESQRLERLVADLLDLARLDAREFRIDPTRVELNAVLEAAAQVWSSRCAQAGVSFVLELPGYPLIVHTDATRLRQALDGLFDNALRVTRVQRPIVLAARAEQYGQQWIAAIDVRDGGPGFTDADLAVAFQKSVLYERYRGERSVGTGLGLAIVAGLVERLGATIEAGHAVEGGARFTIRLPLAQ